MNADSLGQFLMMIFMPFIPILAGAVISFLGVLLIVIMFRGFLPPDPE